MNAVFPNGPVTQFIHISDGHLLMRICCKLQGKEECEKLMSLPLDSKVEIIFSILHNDFNFSRTQGSLISQKVSQGIDLELQLAKVALLLCYCSLKKDTLINVSTSTESVIASTFRFVKDNADGLSLDEGIDQFLTQDFVMNSSSFSSDSGASSSFYTDEESPLFSRRHPIVQFQELCTVASSSDGAGHDEHAAFPVKAPPKELAQEGDIRDELEKELANQISIISEKEGLISQLQHRVERLLREQGELEKDHKVALLELQEKNKSLLHRVHEVLKQCQDLKTDNSQKEKKIDELTEENGTLAAQVRNVFAQLARTEEEVAKLTLAHESSQDECRIRREFLEKELNEAVTHQECLSEQVQILQGKISVLEDELMKAQSQERGEVLGPIMEWEKLKQELADLTLQLAQLQDTISHLEKEKAEVEALLAKERGLFEKETQRLQTMVFDLEQSISSISRERETLQHGFQTQKEMLSAKIEALERDVSRLQQVEVQLTAEIKISADLRQQREELEWRVASLDQMVNALHAEIQGLEMERGSQQDSLNALMVDLQTAKATLQEYEVKLEDHQNLVKENDSLKKEACKMRQEVDGHLQAVKNLQGQISLLQQDKTDEENKLSRAVFQIESLQTQITQLSEQISQKDEEIKNLSNEYDSLGNELKIVREQNVDINEMIKSICKDHEDTIKKLQQELCCAVSTASKKQEEMLTLSAEVTCLKEQICHYNENKLQKQQEFSVLEAEHKVMKENLTSLQNELVEATATTAQKESELTSLHQELRHQEIMSKTAQELKTARCEEYKKTVSELQAKIQEVSSLASEREACVSSLQDEIKDLQLRAKQSEDGLRTEQEEKINHLQNKLDAAKCCVADKEHQLESLEEKLKEMERLCQQKENDVIETCQAKEDVEKRIVELYIEKNQLIECQQNFELLRKEKDQFSDEVKSLKEELSHALEKEQEKLKDVSVLEANHIALKENLAALQNKLVEVTATALQKESELLLLQQELCQQENLRKSAQELETAKCEEFERKVSEFQAKIQEVTALATERETQTSLLQNEIKDQQARAKQIEDDLHKKLEEAVCSRQGELNAANSVATDKEHQLESLEEKLREMEWLCHEKENDVLETRRAKEDLEKRIVELFVEKNQLIECQQNVELLKKEKDQFSDEVKSLKEELSHALEKEQEKLKDVSVLEANHIALKENLAALQNKLVEVTATALQKESELLLLQQELCQQENFRKSAQELETAKCEEFERKVSELQAKIQEVTALATERETQTSLLQNEIKDQQARAKQIEDDLHKKLEEAVCSLQGELNAANSVATDKEHLRESLEEKLREMEWLCQEKENDVLESRQAKEDLEKRIVELYVEKNQLIECQQNLELLKKEKDQFSAKVTSLKEELSHALEKEQQKQKEVSVLKANHNALEENLAALQNNLVEVTATNSRKESELLLLQQELCQQENLRKSAQELETAKCEEFERKVSELKAKIQEVTALATERAAQVSSLQNEIKDQQLRAKQIKDDLHKKLEETVSSLHGEIKAVTADKEHQLESLELKLKEMERLCQEKEKDGRETHQAKVVLEKRIDTLLVEKQNLNECQQNLDILKKERDLLSTELTSLKEEVQSYQENKVQKQHERCLVEAECNTLKENVADLKMQLVEVMTTTALKDSELLTLKRELHQQESLRKEAEGREGAKCEEFERKVSELQAHNLEVSTLSSEKEACLSSLQEKMADHQLKAKQSEDDLRREQEEKIGNLQTQLDVAGHHAADKNLKLREMEQLCQQKDKDALETHQEKEDLEKRIVELLEEKQKYSECMQNLDTLRKEKDHVSDEVTSLKEQVCHYQENQVRAQQDMSDLEVKHNMFKENLAALNNQLVEVTSTASQKESELLLQNKNLKELSQELKDKVLEVSTLASEREAKIGSLQDELKNQHLKAKQSEDDLRKELEDKIEILQSKLETASCHAAEKEYVMESMDHKLREMEVLCQQKEKDVLEINRAKVELERRIVELQVDKQRQDGQQQKTARQWEEQNQELLEQLKIKSEAVEHYKAQVEKAKNHYNGKKQLLAETQEMNHNLENSLEASKREVKALETELTQTRMEVDQAKTKVNSLEAQVDFANRQLREQKYLSDNIKEVRHRETLYTRVQETRQDTSTDSLELELNDSLNPTGHSAMPGESSTPLVRSSERLAAKRHALGAESLETLYFTPMGQQGNKRKSNDALEHKLESSITSFGDLVVDSAKKLTASARRRRTTQVINITLAKKASGEGEESFSSLHSARSHPNLVVQHSRPFSLDFSEDGALSTTDKLQSLPGYRRSTMHTAGPTRATSTFCIGAENEPEHAADDWMRIAELQARNKTCLPHLKSSYPLESRPSLGLPSFTLTDDDLRMGDPDETIRRASMIPDQIQESLNSRRFSLAVGTSSNQSLAQSQPQRTTMLPGQIRSSTAAHRAAQLTKTYSQVRASQNTRSPLASKRQGSQLQRPDTPEAKKLASCFPRPMTPKGRHANSQNRPPMSPAERRQSLMFTVVNTPKNNSRGDSRLQRGLNKLRNSARKSPAVASRALRSAASAVNGKSPLDSRKSPRNKSPKAPNTKKTKFRIKV